MKWFSVQTVLQIKAEDKYGYPDPTPTEMNHVNIWQLNNIYLDVDVNINASYNLYMFQLRMSDISTVSIDWRMLTNARPKTKSDSEFYTK